MGIPECEKNKNYDNCVSDRKCLWVNTQTGEATRIGGEKVPIILQERWAIDKNNYRLVKRYVIEHPPKTNTLIRRSDRRQPPQKKPLLRRAVHKTMKTICRKIGVYPPK